MSPSSLSRALRILKAENSIDGADGWSLNCFRAFTSGRLRRHPHNTFGVAVLRVAAIPLCTRAWCNALGVTRMASIRLIGRTTLIGRGISEELCYGHGTLITHVGSSNTSAESIVSDQLPMTSATSRRSSSPRRFESLL